MNMRRLRHIVAFVTLICVLTTGSLEGRTTTELFSNDASWTLVSPEIDAYMAKWLWVNCKVDLIDMKRTVEGLDLCHSDDMPICSIASSSERQSLIRKNLHKVISIFPPQLKRALVDCLRKQNIMFHVSGEEDGYNIWFAEYLEYLFRWPDPPRRHLVDAFSGISVTPAPSPGVLPPTYGPAPSADPAAPSSEAPGPAPRAEVPSPPRAEAPPPFFPRTLDSTPQPPANVHTSVSPDVASPPSSKKDGRKRVVVAVVVTAGTTFFIAALLFCCYRKYRKNSSPGDGFKDESPLLSISLSDFSGGSSRKGNSIGREKFGTPSFSTSSHNGRPSSLESNFSIELDVDKASVTGASLSVATLGSKPSTDSPAVPDTISASVSPLPPLKPPPGRGGPPPRPPPPGPPPPPIPSGIKPGPRPPPPPMGGAPPRPPQPFSMKPKVTQPSPLGQNHLGSTSAGAESEADAPKTKLKPFFWDKVLANPDQSMVWHQIKSGSFQFNEEMIETLFGYNNADKNRVQRKTESLAQDPSAQYIQIIDSKKAQNLSILLRALNLTTEEVCGALYEGTELPMELCQTLLKMAPTAEEELKLRLYNDDLSQLGPAERFLKVLVNIPFAFKRLDSLCFMTFYQEEVSSIKESLATLEVACKELRNSRLFLKLLEAVLKTGNRMNDGTFRGGAQAFKLDTLLKLADVKGTDGKTTLLQFVVQEIIRSEGVRAARAARENQSLSSVKSDDLFDDSLNEPEEHYRSLGLQVVSRLGVELENVKKASVLDADGLSGTVAKLGHALSKSRDFLNTEMKSLDEDRGFHHTLESFVQNAEVDITWLLEEEKRIMALVKNTADYFHGNAKKDEGLRLFVIVRSFLVILDKTCKEVKESAMRPTRTPRKKESPSVPPSQDVHRRLFPAIVDRRVDNSSSDDEDS